MGLYNFKPRFARKIKDGSKHHTIRSRRKYEDKPGATMHCYTGLRTKQVKLIGRLPCKKVELIYFDCPLASGPIQVKVGNVILSEDECARLARHDGFDCFDEMMAFWKGRIPFEGKIYYWKVERNKADGDGNSYGG